MKKKSGALQAFALIGQIGLNMLVPVALCVFVGHWLDNRFGTNCFLFIFIVLGIMTAYKSLYDLTKRWRKEEKDEQTDETEGRDDGSGG